MQRPLVTDPVRISGMPEVGGGGRAPQFLADQLTLFQPGGKIILTTLLPAPPDLVGAASLCGDRIFVNYCLIKMLHVHYRSINII